MDKPDRNYVESLIVRACNATLTAQDVAAAYGLDDVDEKLTFALDFQRDALAKMRPDDDNPDGTTGPEHVTSEGVALDPPKG